MFTPREEARILRDAEIARQSLDAAPSTHNVNRSPESPRSIRSLDTLDSEARIDFFMNIPIEQQVYDDTIQPRGYPAANRYPPQAVISTRLRDVVHRVPMTCQNALPDQEPIISVGVCECVRDISTFWLTTAHVDWNASLPLAHTSRCCRFSQPGRGTVIQTNGA